MNKPHVKTLTYRVLPAANVDYDRASSIEVEKPEFTVVVDSEKAVFTMKLHYSSEQEARDIVDEFLRAWEMAIGLDIQPGDLSFEFDCVDIVDLSPDESASNELNIHSTSQVQVSDNVTLHVSRAEIPQPPKRFKINPDVETMYNRYKGYLAGREGLLSMAYLCLTIIEAGSGGRGNAAKNYNISKKVLDKLGALVSERGGPEEARKMPRSGYYDPLSGIERNWVIKAIKLIIKRVGECGNGDVKDLPKISLDMLPSL